MEIPVPTPAEAKPESPLVAMSIADKAAISQTPDGTVISPDLSSLTTTTDGAVITPELSTLETNNANAAANGIATESPNVGESTKTPSPEIATDTTPLEREGTMQPSAEAAIQAQHELDVLTEEEIHEGQHAGDTKEVWGGKKIAVIDGDKKDVESETAGELIPRTEGILTKGEEAKSDMPANVIPIRPGAETSFEKTSQEKMTKIDAIRKRIETRISEADATIQRAEKEKTRLQGILDIDPETLYNIVEEIKEPEAA